MSTGMMRRLEHAKGRQWLSKLVKKQGGLCAYCVKPVLLEPGRFNRHQQATLDHVIPLSRGGLHHWENVVAACVRCNAEKGALTGQEFRARRKIEDDAPCAEPVNEGCAKGDYVTNG